MTIKYLIICGHHKEEIEAENWLVVKEWMDRMVARFGPIDLLYRV